MNPVALFIEPKGSLLASLRERKAWLEHAAPGQPLVSHPPHCTLLFGIYGEPRAWIQQLGSSLARVPAFELATDGWQEFFPDALAGGGRTVAYRVRPNDSLHSLQLAAAGVLAPFRGPDAGNHPLAGKEPFAASLRLYGFPFVGPHWIPHFTIGSVAPVVPADLVDQLKSGPTGHRFTVSSVSVWEVAGDRHWRRHELALAGPAT